MHEVWRPWPSATAPELQVALAAPPGAPLAILCGHRQVPRAPQGYALLLGPGEILQPQAAAPAHFDAPRPDAYRLLLLGYELGRPFMHLPRRAPPAGEHPGIAWQSRACVQSCHLTRRYRLGGGDKAARTLLAACLDAPPGALQRRGTAQLWPEVDDRRHASRLGRVLHHIGEGDVYQANLTRTLRLDGHIDPLALLWRLWHANPVAHAALLRTPEATLLSNSMETLLSFEARGRLARSLPIKGTCARRDAGEAQRLVEDSKERAEHLMIVDLVRNDLGRVCTPGSVRVERLMHAEPYRGLWHGVSSIVGELPGDASVALLLQSLFPGGSIIGAPKRSACALLADLEAVPRGYYTGSLGLLHPSGDVSLSILIRTLVQRADGLWRLGVGGGIVADSSAEREIAETWEKVAVFVEALRPLAS